MMKIPTTLAIAFLMLNGPTNTPWLSWGIFANISIPGSRHFAMCSRRPSTAEEQATEAAAKLDARRKEIQGKANQENPKAQWSYAIKYAEGKERIDYLCRAGKQGERNAQNTLARMLHEGDFYPDAPVTIDPVRAYMWYTLAAKIEPFPMATDHRNDLVTSMTPAQIAEGERLAAEWTPESPCP